MKNLLLLFLVFNLHYSNLLYSQVFGQIDTTFNLNDTGDLFANFNGKVNEIIAFPNGNYLVVGAFTEYNNISVNRVVQLNNNGSIDQNFNIGTGANGEIKGVTQLQNGDLILFGHFNDFNGHIVDSVVCLSTNGAVNLSFQLNSSPITWITDIVEESNGSLIISGSMTPFGFVGTAEYTIIKTNPNGVVDNSYGFTSINSSINNIYIDSSNSIYIQGGFSSIQSYTRDNFAKIDTNGLIIPTYSPSLFNTFSSVRDVILEQNGTAVICGTSLSNNTSGCIRLLPNGSIDPLFSSFQSWGHYTNICKDSFGRYYFLLDNNQINSFYRLNNDGSLDSTFHTYFLQSTLENNTYNATIDPSGKLILAKHNGIFRCLDNGALDPTLNLQNGANGSVDVVKTLPSGKILIGGEFTSFNGISLNGIGRLLHDGTVDPTFKPGVGFISTSPYNNNIRTIEVQNDGKIIVGGNFLEYDFNTCGNLVRINTDGSFDTTFNIGLGLDQPVNDIYIRPDGKIMISGGFTKFKYTPTVFHYMYKLGIIDTNGLPDVTSDYGTYMSTPIKTITPLSNGQILLSNVDTYNFLSVGNIIRINTDATRDLSFNTGTGVNYEVIDLGIQSNGKIIIASHDSVFNGNNVDEVFRILPNGSYDSTFLNNDIFTFSSIEQLKVLSDDKILVVGKINGGNGRKQLIRLFSDGGIDSTFFLDTNSLSQTFDIKSFDLTSYNDIIMGGSFLSYNNTNKIRLTKVNNDTIVNNCLFLSSHINNLSNLSCNSPSITSAEAYNGISPLLFSWDNGSFINNDTVFQTNIAGIHLLTIKDSVGCVNEIGFLVNGPSTSSGFDNDIHLITNTFRPGFNNSTSIDALNHGCIPVDGDLILIIDTTNISYNGATPAPDNIIGDSLIWHYTGLAYDSTHLNPTISFTTKVNAQIGDSVHLKSLILPKTGDIDSLNNEKLYSFPIQNGYDPNDKKVYPIGQCIPNYISNDQLLTYTIRFQNMGNSEAININIIDSISPNLDVESLKIISSSHEMHTEIYPNRVAKFIFNNINLPDSSSNPLGSQGYVIFSLEQNGYLYPNEIIKNKAEIYFDFNPEISTNEVTNVIFEEYEYYIENITTEECDSIFLYGEYYNSSGIFEIHDYNIYGCDSIHILNLQINESTDSIFYINGLDSVTVNSENYTTSGVYNQTLVNMNGCDSILEIHAILNYSEIIEFTPNNQFLLFPNPTNGIINFKYESFIQDLNIFILSQEDRIISKYTFNNVNQGQIDLKHQKTGVYFIKIILNDEVFIFKVIKV